MMEFWINSSSGLPFFFVTAQVNEKEFASIIHALHPSLGIIIIVS
jgi:hypothetical protein